MAFSPDDIYLAVGREDNIIQVWDTRYVSTSPMLQMCHFNGIVSEDEAFGIARNLQWVDHRHRLGAGLGLVTGGDGGSLCLWDIQKAEGARQVIAELAFSITTVLIPDPTQYPQVRVIM
jgi:WD40 repeat protein